MDLLDWITAVLAGIAVVAALANPLGRAPKQPPEKPNNDTRP